MQTAIYPLDRQALLRISGQDSETFLQGQLSCDIREVTLSTSQLAAHCTPKGSMHSIMRVIKINEGFLLRCNSENIEYTQSNLTKYMMFSKASCDNLSDEWSGIGVMGDEVDSFLSEHLCGSISNSNDQRDSTSPVVIKVPGNRYEIWAPTKHLNELINKVASINVLTSSSAWYKEEITQGIPDIFPQTRELFIPQMCNLQALGGVSFKKGCYTGQEVITRLHFRGKLTKYLTLAKISTEAAGDLTIGSSIFNQDGTKAASVLQLSEQDEYFYVQLIVNHKQSEQQLFLSSNEALTKIELPYSLDPELFIRKS